MKILDMSQYKNRWWDWTAILLLSVVLSAAYTRLIATGWTESLDVTRSITYLGLMAGLVLGFSRFSPRWTFIFALFFGTFVVPWRIGKVFGDSVAWSERLISLAGRLEVIIRHLIEQRPVPDNLFFIVLMSIILWVISVHAGYSLTRNANPWSMTLPAGVVIVLIHSYDPLSSRLWYLVAYLFFSLLIIARLVYIKNRKRWEQNHTYMPPYLGVDFVRIATMATVILLLVTWTAPALANSIPAAQSAWQQIKQPWNELRNTLDNAFASLKSSLGIVADYYGPNLGLGRGNRLSDTVVFYAFASEEPPDGVRYYWRARVYDIYQNGWSTSLQTTREMEPDKFDLNLPDTHDNTNTNYPFSFQVGVPFSTLMTPHQTVWVSRPSKIEYAPNPDGSIDLASMRASPPLKAGETYQARASFNMVTVDKLRKSGTEYPEWVTERYLQLPDSITNRTIELGNRLAGNLETPYDKAAAITNFLRLNIDYAESVPTLPVDQDLVDWFIFDLGKGFCNYYASAEIVLLRSVGVPARMAVGYAQGEKIPDSDSWIIRQKDAHAWPEVYFPGIGWVEFEPTASQPVLVRPLGFTPENSPGSANNLTDDDPIPDFDLDARERDLREEDPGLITNQTQSIYFLVLISLTIAFILLLIPFIRRRQLYNKLPAIPIILEKSIRRLGLQPPAFLETWAIRAALSPLARAYSEINLALTRLGNRPKLTDTPSERAATLSTALPPAANPTQILLHEYQLGIYSSNHARDVQAAKNAGSEIRSLSIRETISRFLFRKQKTSNRYDRFR